MPLFLSEEEFRLISSDASAVAERADAVIRDLRQQLDFVRAESDAKSIAEEQNCALLEQKYDAVYSELSRLQYENTQLSASAEKSLSELADAQAEKHQLHIKAIGKDGEIEKLSLEVTELHISKRQLLELVDRKDAEIRERDVTIQSYVDKIIHMSENSSSRESKLNAIETKLTCCQATCTRLTQEKELIEKQNVWLDEELTQKANSLFELRRAQMDIEADASGKIVDLERLVKEYSNSLNNSKERARELELRVKSLEEDLRLSKDIAATNEEHFNVELSTVNKLVELYKASSEEWSKKAGELEGVIKALEAHLSQVENDYKEKSKNEASLRTDLENEISDLKMKLEKCEAELEKFRKANESGLIPLSVLSAGSHVEDMAISEIGSDVTQMLVPRITAGVSGTALAASLLRDGWSLTKMYEKYHEASDAQRHEKWGRKHAEAILERVLHEIEEKAEMILEERAEHERMVEAYAAMNEKLQQALVEHDSYEKASRILKAELRQRERECSIAQKEINDLQKQVTVLLKECQDIQLRCGGNPQQDALMVVSKVSVDLINADTVYSENHLSTFKDINELVEQNVKLRSLVHRLSTDEEKKETELRYNFQVDMQRVADDASSKVEVVLKRSEEQASMIESLHSSVAMYKRLYEEEHKFRTSSYASATAVSDDGKKELMLLFEGSQEISRKAYEQLSTRSKILEEDVAKLSTELISVRAERDKMSLEANFSKERLHSFMKEFDHQRVETNAVSARNMELTHLLIDYQKRLRESSASLQASEENSRKQSMEVSILKHERELLATYEKRTTEEIQTLMERVHRLQSSLDTIQSAEEAREIARVSEKRKQDDYFRRLERDWVEAKRELQEERDRVRMLTLEKDRLRETSLNQVEDIRKELANAWHSVATAESRAAVAEARCSDVEAKIKSTGKQAITVVGDHEQLGLSSNEITEELWKTKEELEKVKDDAHASKEYMLQYKEMARTNEIALKQLELAHESYKSEAVKLKKILEDEAQSLRNQVSELERNYILKCEEVASTTESKEKALSSALVETSRLRDEVTEKLTSFNELQIQVSSLQDDLEKEQKRWRTAQDNYERQVILQSETIQELTNTSRELSLKQAEISRLQGLLDAQKAENELLKSSWETEKSELLQMKSEAERKYNEMLEQNKILHNRLEALHGRLAEKEHNSFGLSAVSSHGDGDLQTVISYLRRSKEIAETEITLLKQEKMRLQSKVDGTLKASESAQALLHSQLETSRELLLKEDEFKSLQLQVREINLLRESNVQLREENKHNFEECQKLREEAQKAEANIYKLENLLKQKQNEIDDFQKGAESLKIEISNLNTRNSEILESHENININEREQMKEELQQIKNALATKQELIIKLEQDLTNCHEELSERVKKLNDAQNGEANLKQEFDKQKKYLHMWKNKNQSIAKEKEGLNFKNQALTKEIEDLKIINQTILKEKEDLNCRNQVLTKEKEDVSSTIQVSAKERDEFISKIQALTKEKEELNSKNQAILKQIEDFKSGRKVFCESEQAKKEQEKDTRIQMLEKTLERERNDARNDRQKWKKNEDMILDCFKQTKMDKQKVEDELQKHKSAIASIFEKTGIAASLLPSSSSLDEQTMSYFQSVSSVEAAKTSFFNDAEGPQCSPAIASTSDNSAGSTGQKVLTQQTKLPKPNYKTTEEREKAPSVGRSLIEARKPGRRFVRPNLEKLEEPTTDTEVIGMENSSTLEGKASSSIENEVTGDSSITLPIAARKRLVSREHEILEGSVAHNEINIAAPPHKRAKESDFSEIAEAYDIPQSSENPGTSLQGLSQSKVSETQISQPKDELELDNLPSTSNEGYLNVGKEDEDNATVTEEAEQQKEYLDVANPEEVEYEADIIMDDLSDRPSSPIETHDQGLKNEKLMDILYSATEVEGEKEEGELIPDEPEIQPVDLLSEEGQHGFSIGEGTGSGDEAVGTIEIESPNNEQGAHDSVDLVTIAHDMVTDVEDVAEISEKRNSSGVDQVILGSEQSPEISTGVRDESPISFQQNLASGQLNPVSPAETGESQPARSTRTISLVENAKRNAQIRQAGLAVQQPQQQQQQQIPPSRGRIFPRRRGSNQGRGRGGRG